MYERLLSKDKKPSVNELESYCGENENRFRELNTFLTEKLGTTLEIRFPYGKNYGWSITHRKSKKLICDIFAESQAFTVMLRLTDKQYESLFSGLHEYTKKCIKNKYPCGNGGWIHYRVKSDENLEDIKILLTEKYKRG